MKEDISGLFGKISRKEQVIMCQCVANVWLMCC